MKKYTKLPESTKYRLNSLFLSSYEKLTISHKAKIYETGFVN